MFNKLEMKVYCKESYIDTNVNFFKICGAGYGERYTKWCKGCFYNTSPNTMVEPHTFYIESENTGHSSTLTKKEFDNHFLTIEDLRNERIEQIIKK